MTKTNNLPISANEPCSIGSGAFYFLQNVKTSFAISYICALLIIKLNTMEIGRVYKRKGGIMAIDNIMHFRHRFVCIEKNIGIMITHSSRFENNIKFRPEHITKGDCFVYEDSCFMAQYLLKEIDDSDLVDCGGVTDEGLMYIKEQKCGKAITWREYIERYNSNL